MPKKYLLPFIFLFFSLGYLKAQENKEYLNRLLVAIDLTQKGSFNEAQSSFDSLFKDTIQIKTNWYLKTRLWLNYSNLISLQGNQLEAIKYLERAYYFAEKDHNPKLKAGVLTNLGAIQQEVGNFNGAFNYYYRVKSLAQEKGNESLLLAIYINLGVIHDYGKNPDSAIYYNQKALKYALLNKDLVQEARINNNLSIIYRNLNQLSKAKAYNERTIEIGKSLNDTFLVSVSYMNLSNILYNLGDFQKANEYTQKSLELAERINAYQVMIEGYESMYNRFKQKGDYKNALLNLEKFTEQKEKYLNSDIKLKVTDLEKKFQNTLKEKELLRLTALQKEKDLLISKREAEILKIWALVIIILLISLSIIITYYFWTNKQKLKLESSLREEKVKQILIRNETQERERKRIAKDLHDEFGTGLSKINMLSQLISYTKESINEELKAKSFKISKICLDLTLEMKDFIWALNLKDASLKELIQRIRATQSEQMEEMEINFHLQENQTALDSHLNMETSHQLYVLIKELISNTMKHAKAKNITLDFEINSSLLIINYKDDGIGFDPLKIKKDSYGLGNIESRVKSISGTYHLDSILNQGTSYLIEIPIG